MKKMYIFVFFYIFQALFLVAEERAYVTNWEADNISVIKTSNNTVMETISTDTGPMGLAFTPDYEYVYVTNYGSAACNNKVTVIQTSDNTIVTTITVGNCPAQIAITPDGEFGYVANYFSDSFSVIEISSNTVVATVTMGDGPMGVTITPDGQYAYFAMEQAGTVQVVQISDNTIVATVNVGSSPYRIAITPDGAYAYVTNRFSDNVSVIQTSNNTVIATIGVGDWPHGIAITSDGEYAYVVNFFMSNSVSVIQTSTNSVVNTIAVGSWPKAIAFTYDEEYAYVTNGGGNSISVIEISTGTVVETIPVNANPSGIIIGNCPEGSGWIEGIVTLEGGAGNVEEVVVTAGIESTNPDATGFYSIEIEPGTYDVIATLEYYETDTILEVIVEEGITTSNVDLTLLFDPPLNPPQNFQVDPYTALATWDPPEPIPGLELLEYNVFLDSDMFTTTATQWQFENLINGITYTTGIQVVYDFGESEIVELEFTYLGTGAEDDVLCNKAELLSNYPNPFNPSTTIFFETTSLRNASARQANLHENSRIEIYNIKGQKVKTLECGESLSTTADGVSYSISWNGTDENNQSVSSGIYFYQLVNEMNRSNIEKMLLLK